MKFDEWKSQGEFVDEVKIKGFSYVRSDVATVTKELQYEVLEALMLDDNPHTHVVDTCMSYIENIMNGEIPADEYGISFGISKDPEKYGSADRTPQPQFRGAKWSNQYIYNSKAIDSTSDPMYYYVDEIRDGPYPKTYTADTAEDGRYVDAIAVLDGSDIPDEVVIDKRKMIQKTVLSYVDDIIKTMNWDYDQLEDHLDRQTPAEYYREQGQTGLGSENFM